MMENSEQVGLIQVSSDIGLLKRVVVHRPDPGIEWVTPSNANELLYDDIVFLPQMIHQHQRFVEVLTTILGVDAVVEFQNLLEDILADYAVREELVNIVIAFENLSKRSADYLKNLPAVSLAAVLIAGVVPGISKPVLSPLPNHIFTRDIGVAINNSFLTCIAGKTARKRESILAWFVAHHHPLISGKGTNFETDFIDLCPTAGELLQVLSDNQLAIEGGDVMLIDKHNLFIGSSLRTNEQSIEKVAALLFEKNAVKRVTMIEIPKQPTCIHLDTLFTQISSTDFVYYRPFMVGEINIKQFRGSVNNSVTYNSLMEVVKEIEPEARFIPCGNGKYPYEEREQYASGCNFVSLKEGVAVSYARNLKTLEALKEHGYQIISAGELLNGIRLGLTKVDKLESTIIAVRSSELSRAGGGPHCLTMPLVRL